jgi:hypothetical protein
MNVAKYDKKPFDAARIFLLLTTLAVFSCVSILPKTNSVSPLPFKADCRLNPDRFVWPEDHSPKLVWISIDSLNESGLRELVPRLKSPHPFGFKKILEHANKQSRLKIHDPTITAPSHISTITCSSAERHGTFANSQWSGNRMVSGFTRLYGTETFATSIKNAGFKVVTAGYPTLDNAEPTRSVSEGFAYGVSLSRSAIVKIGTSAKISHTWSLENEKPLEVRIKPVRPLQNKDIECKPMPCTVSASGVDDIFDITFKLQTGSLRGYIQILNENEFYFSQLKMNKTFPESVNRLHEQCGLIFSPGKNPALASYGVRATLSGMKHNLRYFNLNWAHYLPLTRADALFMYLEDLDALRHQLADHLPHDIEALDHLAQVDTLVGDFLQSLPKETNVVILGDHGMSTVKRELNIRQILPASTLEQVQIVTSGGSLFLYGRDSQSTNMSNTPSRAELIWLANARHTLLNFKDPTSNQNVFTQVLIKGSAGMQKAGLAHREAPFLIAFAHPDFAIKDSLTTQLTLSDTSRANGPSPIPPGQHGHTSQHALMSSFVTGWGPQLNTVRFDSLKSNLEVVPVVGNALKLPIPKHCR